MIDLPLALLRVLVALVGPVVVLLTLPFASVREGMKHLPVWASWWGNPTYGTYGNASYQNIRLITLCLWITLKVSGANGIGWWYVTRPTAW